MPARAGRAEVGGARTRGRRRGRLRASGLSRVRLPPMRQGRSQSRDDSSGAGGSFAFVRSVTPTVRVSKPACAPQQFRCCARIPRWRCVRALAGNSVAGSYAADRWASETARPAVPNTRGACARLTSIPCTQRSERRAEAPDGFCRPATLTAMAFGAPCASAVDCSGLRSGRASNRANLCRDEYVDSRAPRREPSPRATARALFSLGTCGRAVGPYRSTAARRT